MRSMCRGATLVFAQSAPRPDSDTDADTDTDTDTDTAPQCVRRVRAGAVGSGSSIIISIKCILRWPMRPDQMASKQESRMVDAG